MILIHEKANRGQSRMGWLDSHHTFSFGGFNDPTRMGFGNLRVLNEDHIIPGAGFARHRHESMDILTVVLAGNLRHEDDQGHVQTIRAGEVQMMSAGDGIEHSEWNASDTETAHVLQIWLIPDTAGGQSSYALAALPTEGDEVLLAGSAGACALLPLRSASTVRLVRAKADEGLQVGAKDAQAFVQIVSGIANAEGERISAGDGLQLPIGEAADLRWITDGSALVFDMPPVRRRQ